MKPSTKFLRIAGWVLLALAGLTMLYYVWHFTAPYNYGILDALECILFVCAPLIAGGVLFALSLDGAEKRRRAVRALLKILFGFYLFTLLAALVIMRIDFDNYAADRAFYQSHWELMTNFIPFTTIRLYIRCLIYDFIGTTIPLSNLMGNVFLFMPMALFLPCIFPSMQRFWRFLLLMLAILVAVEALQLALCCGSCDVDDVILNLFGTLSVYGLIRIPFIKRFLVRCYLWPERAAADQPDNA